MILKQGSSRGAIVYLNGKFVADMYEALGAWLSMRMDTHNSELRHPFVYDTNGLKMRRRKRYGIQLGRCCQNESRKIIDPKVDGALTGPEVPIIQ